MLVASGYRGGPRPSARCEFSEPEATTRQFLAARSEIATDRRVIDEIRSVSIPPTNAGLLLAFAPRGLGNGTHSLTSMPRAVFTPDAISRTCPTEEAKFASAKKADKHR